jgi:hypothetical protein
MFIRIPLAQKACIQTSVSLFQCPSKLYATWELRGETPSTLGESTDVSRLNFFGALNSCPTCVEYFPQ